MKRFGLLMLLAVLGWGSAQVGCNSKAASPTAPNAPAVTYSFQAVLGAYDAQGQNEPWWDYGYYNFLYDEGEGVYESNGEFPTAPVTATYDQPSGVATSGNFVFVADSYTGFISKFDLSGNFISSWFAYGAGSAFEYGNWPIGMAADSHGHLYVANIYLAEVDVYDFNGNWLGYLDPGEHEFDCPMGVALDANDNLFVADPCNGELYKIAQTGFQETCCPTFPGALLAYTSVSSPNNDIAPVAVAVNAGGNNVYISDSNNDVVDVYDSGLNYKSTIGTDVCNTCPTTATGEFSNIGGLTLDNQGNLLVCDDEGNGQFGRVEKFSPSGQSLGQFGLTTNTEYYPVGPPIWTSGQLLGPGLIAVDANNNVYVQDWDWDLVFKYAQNN